MKKKAFHIRLKFLREHLSEIPSDTLWILQPENRRYLSGFKAVDTQINESSGSLLIKDDASLLVTDSRYSMEAQKESVDFDVFIKFPECRSV